jgi:DNA polymerase-3 subunit alpha
MITKVRTHITKNGRNAGSKMAVFILEDLQGQAEVVLFPDCLNRYSEYLVEDRVIFVRGRVDCRRENPNIFAEELIALDQVTEKLAARVKIRLDSKDVTKEKIAEIKNICQYHRGKSPVYVAIKTDKGRIYATADKSLCVNPDVDFCRKIRQLVGEENLQLGK